MADTNIMLYNNKYTAIKIQLNTGDLISIQLFFLIKDKYNSVLFHFKHTSPSLQTNLQELGLLVSNKILEEQLLPVYYASVVFTKIKISLSKSDGEVPAEQWVFLLPKSIYGKGEGVAPREKHAVFELQVLQETSKGKIITTPVRSVQTVYRYFVGMADSFQQPFLDESILSNSFQIPGKIDTVQKPPTIQSLEKGNGTAAEILAAMPKTASALKKQEDNIRQVESLFINGINLSNKIYWKSILLKGKDLKEVETVSCVFRGVRVFKKRKKSTSAKKVASAL